MARAKVYYRGDNRVTYDDGRYIVLGENYVHLHKESGEIISYPVRNVVRTIESP